MIQQIKTKRGKLIHYVSSSELKIFGMTLIFLQNIQQLHHPLAHDE